MQILEDGIAKTLLREVLREPLEHFGIGRDFTCGFASHCETPGLRSSEPPGRRDLSVCRFFVRNYRIWSSLPCVTSRNRQRREALGVFFSSKAEGYSDSPQARRG